MQAQPTKSAVLKDIREINSAIGPVVKPANMGFANTTRDKKFTLPVKSWKLQGMISYNSYEVDIGGRDLGFALKEV